MAAAVGPDKDDLQMRLSGVPPEPVIPMTAGSLTMLCSLVGLVLELFPGDHVHAAPLSLWVGHRGVEVPRFHRPEPGLGE